MLRAPNSTPSACRPGRSSRLCSQACSAPSRNPTRTSPALERRRVVGVLISGSRFRDAHRCGGTPPCGDSRYVIDIEGRNVVSPKHNIAARAGRWSAGHRKTALIGWLLFTVLAFMGGQSAGLSTIKSTELGVGEAGRADTIVGEAWPQQSGEAVLISSSKLKSSDPQFKSAVAGLATK